MAIYDQDLEYRKLNANKNAEVLGALQAFGNFINQKKANNINLNELEARKPYYEQQANLANAQAEYYRNRSMGSFLNPGQAQDPNLVKKNAAKNTGFDPDDFDIKPIVRSVNGVPQAVFVPQLKKEIPQTLFKEFQSMTKTASALKQNLGMLDENEGDFAKEMNYFNPKAKRGGSFWGGIGTMLLKLDPKSKEFATFRAETDKAFQTYRKETTGAQAALAELGWLAPDFPETDDNPELYKQKAIEAIRRINEGEQLLMENLSTQGYRTSGLKKLIESRVGGGQEQSGDRQEPSSGAVPSVGGSFNGAKVLKVTRVK